MTRYRRVREQGEFTPITRTIDFVGYDGSTSSSSYDTKALEGETKYMVDYVTSNYAARSGKGDVIMSPMSSTVEQRTIYSSNLSVKEYLGGSNYNTYNMTNGYYMLSRALAYHMDIPIDINQLETLAGTAAAADISAPDFQGTVFLAELRETLRFLRAPLSTITNTVKRAKRQARKQKKEFSKLSLAKRRRIAQQGRYSTTYQGKLINGELALADFVSANWLQYRYGIVPLQHDIVDFMSALTLKAAPVNRKTARGYAFNTGSDSTVLTSSTGHVDITKNLQTTRRVEVRAGILYSWTHTDTFGMNLRELPIGLWEAIPGSFLFDWFSNAADVFRAITPKQGVTRHADWTTRVDVTESLSNGTMSSNDTPGEILSWDLITTPTSKESILTTKKKRDAGNKVGFATFPIPFEGELGTKRIIDSLSLLTQLLLSKI